MKRVSVRLDDETHRQVKVRAAAEGVAMEALGRAFFEEYAERGLAAGDHQEMERQNSHAEAPVSVGERSSSAQSDSPNLLAPAAKPCRKTAMHHIYHGGNRCPECGWPK